jgi:transcription initiation factor TFIIIB Brf1 subunit/transcription initiation factor TFIIB
MKTKKLSVPEYMIDFSRRLNMSKANENIAFEYLEQLNETIKYEMCRPRTMAASILYIVCILHNDRRIRSEFYSVTGVEPVPLSSCAYKFLKILNLETEYRKLQYTGRAHDQRRTFT